MPLGKIESFNINDQNWDTYVRRVKQFIALNEVKETLHVSTLVTIVGSQCYDLMCDLCAPDLPEDKKFDELVKLVKDHLEPERSEIAERHVFRQRKQAQGESVRSYLQSLKHLAKTCNFESSLEVNLRDQFVSGLFSEDMRSRLFAEKNINYKRSVELAFALEAAERHASGVAGAPAAASSSVALAKDEGLHRVGGGGGAARSRQPAPASGGAAAAAAAPRQPCSRCGRSGHVPGRCRYKFYSCDKCGEKGHLKAMCKRNDGNVATKKGQYFLDDTDSDDDCHFYNLVSSVGDKPYYIRLNVENTQCKFEIDTGSKISAISKSFYDDNFSKLSIVNRILTFRSYTGDVIETLGYIMVHVKCGLEAAYLKLYVINNGGPPLLGRIWIKHLKLSLFKSDNDTIHNVNEGDSMAISLRKQFPEVFADGLGTCKSRIRLHLNEETPVFVKARPLPLALRERVEQELDRLQREGVIYKVERSDYGTPIVPVVKANGDIRICGDYKVTINPRLKDFHYPLPRIADLFATLGGGEQYTKLDLSNAFQQCLLEEDSQPLSAITTHVGTFVYSRVPFGIKCIPENFQKIMEETLSGLPSTAVFADDICVTGSTKSIHMANLRAVLQRLNDNGLRINFSKCQFFRDSVTYLGYKIDKFGLHTDSKKVEAIVSAPVPANVTQLRSFLGLVNFYSKFCPNSSDVLKPMYSLLKKGTKWNWDDSCEAGFSKIKKLLSSSPVLAHYDPNLPLILSVDSSQYGLGAVLAQRHADGSERPVCCASRTLNAAECNYSQLDKEALAIVFGVTKHHQYLYGRKFLLRSDHQALSYILGKNKGIPVTAASRLQRYAVKLAAYDYDIAFVRSEQNSVADALSRLPLAGTGGGAGGGGRARCEDDECSYLSFVQDSLPVSFNQIKAEMAKDPLLGKINGYVMFGWPSSHVEAEAEKPFARRKDSLHSDRGCLVWGYRIVIPKSLQETVLSEIHEGHPGIVRMKQIARNYVWWETLDADIERVCAACEACRSQRAAPPPAPLHSWPWPHEPWARLNMDFLGPFRGKYYLVIVDAHSKWIEVAKVASTSASSVIGCLRRLFARFGLPKRIVTDNGPPFSSSEFGTYLQGNGIRHSAIAPYHPASNGAAENAVRTIKRVLKKACLEGMDDDVALCKFLFMYRNSEHSTTGREPAVAMFGRRLRGRLDLLRADTGEAVREKQLQQEQRDAQARPLRVLAPQDKVLARDYSARADKWTDAVVLERSGPVSYKVKTTDGRVQKRHVDQLLADKSGKSRFSLSDLGQKSDCELGDAKSGSYENIGSPSSRSRACSPRMSTPMCSTPDSPYYSPQMSTPATTPTAAAATPAPVERTRRRAALECFKKLKKQT